MHEAFCARARLGTTSPSSTIQDAEALQSTSNTFTCMRMRAHRTPPSALAHLPSQRAHAMLQNNPGREVAVVATIGTEDPSCTACPCPLPREHPRTGFDRTGAQADAHRPEATALLVGVPLTGRAALVVRQRLRHTHHTRRTVAISMTLLATERLFCRCGAAHCRAENIGNNVSLMRPIPCSQNLFSVAR